MFVGFVRVRVLTFRFVRRFSWVVTHSHRKTPLLRPTWRTIFHAWASLLSSQTRVVGLLCRVGCAESVSADVRLRVASAFIAVVARPWGPLEVCLRSFLQSLFVQLLRIVLLVSPLAFPECPAPPKI